MSRLVLNKRTVQLSLSQVALKHIRAFQEAWGTSMTATVEMLAIREAERQEAIQRGYGGTDGRPSAA